jgi:tetratricopeptide (TPR) repeat protein
LLIKRLVFTWITVTLVLLGGELRAAAPSTDLRGLDNRTQLLKEEVLKLNRDLIIFAQDVTYPAATQVEVFVSVETDDPFPLDTIQLKIDDDLIVSHSYTASERNALFHGGVHRLYTGNLPAGEHGLSASIIAGNADVQDHPQRAALIFYKKSEPKLIELKIVKPRLKQLKASFQVTARESKWGEVRDPHFGEAVFEYYQDKYFSAATDLLAAQATRTMQQQNYEEQLLLGDLYLAYGLHRRADRLFSEMTEKQAPPDVSARAHFYLAKTWYERGYLKEAQAALLNVRDALPPELVDERRTLLALALMKQNRYGEAVGVLSQLHGKSDWAVYARYNMGVGLIQIGRTKEGVAQLEKIAHMHTDRSDVRTLQDKANLALGFTFLGVPDPQRAKSYFGEVRLDGPFAGKALLGIGWALSAKGKHKQSLVPWMELLKSRDFDVAVSETLLAVPYAFTELGAYKQALAHYEQAIGVYNAEIERLEKVIESLRAGDLLAVVLPADADSDDRRRRPTPAENLPDTPENRYLIQLFASNDFHQALRSYRDLRSLSRNLECWSAIVSIEDRSALLSSLKTAKEKVDDDNDALQAGEPHDCGRLNSARHWQFTNDYKPNLLRMAYAQSLTGGAPHPTAPAEHQQRMADADAGDIDARITPLRVRVAQLKSEIDLAAQAYERYLQGLAALELEHQKQRLRSYVTQARFGIAQVYDRASRDARKTQ